MKTLKIKLIAIILFASMSNINAQTTNTFKDSRDGKTYKTVKIGEQVWMAENLAFKANSGCWAYNDSLSYVDRYGYLYSWETSKNVCPSGYHLPTKVEFETLLNNYGGSKNSKANYVALMSNKSSGFAAILSGWHDSDGFVYIGEATSFWTTSAFGNDNAWIMSIYNNPKIAIMISYKRSSGQSVRCLKD